MALATLSLAHVTTSLKALAVPKSLGCLSVPFESSPRHVLLHVYICAYSNISIQLDVLLAGLLRPALLGTLQKVRSSRHMGIGSQDLGLC